MEIEDVLSQLKVTDYRLNVIGHNALGGLQCMGMESVHSSIADMPVCCQRDQFLFLVQAPRTSGVGESFFFLYMSIIELRSQNCSAGLAKNSCHRHLILSRDAPSANIFSEMRSSWKGKRFQIHTQISRLIHGEHDNTPRGKIYHG